METETKVNILSTHQAYLNCIKSNNTDWQSKNLDKIEETLLDALPHGCGIDYDWVFEILPNKIICSNSYHVMNDGGYYDGFIDFVVVIKTEHRTIHKQLDYKISGRFGSKYADIKDYLYQTIDYSLCEL